ncbi:cupin domain-containing protein [Streptomyces sp. R08]|uniref:Cupin domain-containing protein n=1 Tax=Streptomyces sp. R08 TaxID=3238624 RepID=A0AB39MMJ5_9ACTN
MAKLLPLIDEMLSGESPSVRLFKRAAVGFPFSRLTLDVIEERFVRGEVWPFMVSVLDGGSRIPAHRYTVNRRRQAFVQEETIDPDRLLQLLASGASLSMHNCDQWIPELAGITNDIRQVLGRPAMAGLFLSPPGASGLPCHTDVPDVFAVQLDGTKTWTVYERPPGPPRQRVVAEGELPKTVLNVTLEPGDVLYVPAGSPHIATAGPVSLHVSIGVRAPTLAEALIACLEQSDAVPEILRRPVDPRPGAAGPREVLAEAMAELAKAPATATWHSLLESRRGRDLAFWETGTFRQLTGPAADDRPPKPGDCPSEGR